MPPKLGQVRRGIAPAPTTMPLTRAEGDDILLPTPLFWDGAPWHEWHPVIAQAVLIAMQSRGVLVSAMLREVGLPIESTDEEAEPSSKGESKSAREEHHDHSPQMLPYRNERYGLTHSDFDVATVIDMQLSAQRDSSGRFAYSAERLGRWERSPEDEPLSGGGWVPAMTLPPDVPSLGALQSKLSQLRRLAPQAAVIISAGPEWLEQSLPDLLSAGADALLVRLGQIRMPGLALAQFTQRLIQRVEAESRVPVWLVPPKSPEKASLSVNDSIKLLALGASAIAVDCWMESVCEEIAELQPPSSYATDPLGQAVDSVERILEDELDPSLERFEGLYSSLIHDRPADLLGTFEPDVAKLLHLPCIGPVKQTDKK